MLFEDNVACITQIKKVYIKSDRTKHIPLKFFSFTQELKKTRILISNIFDQGIIQQISSQKHFPLQLSESLFVISGYVICEIYEEEILINLRGSLWLYSFSLTMVLSHWVFMVRFLMRQHRTRMQE